MKYLTILALVCLLCSCKKDSGSSNKVNETMSIAVSSVPTGGGYTITCTDAASSSQTPFFSISSTVDKTYTTNVYSGETVHLDDNFVVNGVYHFGAVITVSVNGAVILTTPYNEDSDGHSITIK
jgi:hypothetical protein